MTEGDARRGAIGADLGPEDARACCARGSTRSAWRADRASCSPGCSPTASRTPTCTAARGAATSAAARGGRRARSIAAAEVAAPLAAGLGLFDPGLHRHPLRAGDRVPRPREAEAAGARRRARRVALVADGIGGMHGVTHTLDEIRERGVPGFEVEVIGTDPNVDRRLSAVAEVDIPFYAGLKIGVPSLPAIVEALAEGRYDARAPLLARAGRRRRRAGRADHGAADGRLLPHRARRLRGAALRRPGSSSATRRPRRLLRRLRRRPLAVAGLRRPAASSASPPSGSGAGTAASTSRASIRAARRGAVRRRPRQRPVRRAPDEGEGRRPARRRVPRRARAATRGCTSCWPAAGPRRTRCASGSASAATFLGWLEGDELARAYASADLFLFCSQTDTFGQVMLEAQASGLPVVAVAEGGPC